MNQKRLMIFTSLFLLSLTRRGPAPRRAPGS